MKTSAEKIPLSLTGHEGSQSLDAILPLWSICCGGSFLYIFDAKSACLYKLGRGDRGITAGEVLASAKDVTKLIRDAKGLHASQEDTNETKPVTIELLPPKISLMEKSHLIAVDSTGYFGELVHNEDGAYHSALIECVFPTKPDPSQLPTLRGHSYFEVTVHLPSDDSGIIGVGFSSNTYFSIEGDQMIGWIPGSYGYHSDDGTIHGVGELEVNWPTFKAGDIVGCGINYDTSKIFYTLNGRMLGEAFDLLYVPSDRDSSEESDEDDEHYDDFFPVRNFV